MNSTALTYIAESVVKAVGVAGIEAMAMKNAIYSIWQPLAESLVNEVIENCFTYDDIREEYIDAIYSSHRIKMTTDFIEEARPYVEEYAGYAWDRGREDAFEAALSGLLPLQKDQESIITSLVSLTGSTRENVQKTIGRWFEETQGQYFDRFIVPETARLLSHEQGANLAQIGKDYKKFVEAEGYWSSVSEFNSESSKVFAQVQALHEMNVTEYTIIAVMDKKTCAVCAHLHGSVWSVEEAVVKVYDMLISEPDAAYDMHPFPPRSTPKDFEDPKDSPYNLPPFHPRCRCNVRSTHSVRAMPQEVLARPFDAGPKPTNKLLNKVYSQYVKTPNSKEVKLMVQDGAVPKNTRALTNAEKKVAKEAWESMPLEVKKWASRNTENFELLIEEGEDIVSRVDGHKIFMNKKFFDSSRYGPQPLQHELRHAIVNRSVIDARGGGNTIWRELTTAHDDLKKGWRMPKHCNSIYQLNGNGGLRAAANASDEFLAMIGDYYEPNMSLDQLVKQIRHKSYGIEISDKIGSDLVSKAASRWSAKEAKNAASYWWYAMDIDNMTLLSKKQMLAKLAHKPMTAQVRAIAINNELALRDLLRSAGIKQVYQEGDNAPFDIWVGADPEKWYSGKSKKKPWAVIEVKTIVRAKNDKITMHKESLARKRTEHRKFGKKNTTVHTIVFDERTGKYYYRDDLGSFRLSAMQEVTLDDIQRMFGGEATGAVRQLPEGIVQAPRVQVEGGAPAKYRMTWKKQTSLKKATEYLEEKFNTKIIWPETRDMFGDAYPAKAKLAMINDLGEDIVRMNNDRGMYRHWTVPKSGGKYAHDIDATHIGLVNDELVNDSWFDIGKRTMTYQGDGEAAGVFMQRMTSDGHHRIVLVGAMDEFEKIASNRLTREKLILGSYDKTGSVTVARNGKLGMFEHEMGHSLSAYMRRLDEENFTDQWEYWVEMIYESETKAWWARKVSTYAKTNAEEAFAESFSAFMHPLYDSGPKTKLPKKVHDFFTNWLGSYKQRVQMAPSTERLAAISSASPKVKVKPASSLKIKDTIDEGNVNVVNIVTVGKGRKKYIFKPISGESYYSRTDIHKHAGDIYHKFGVTVTKYDEFTDEMWEYIESVSGNVREDYLLRQTMDNLDLSLAQREAFALDVGQRLGFDNEYATVPKFLIAQNEDGTMAGVLIEFIDHADVETKWFGRRLHDEESFQMAVFDYLIGNTDRHENNFMRRRRKPGRQPPGPLVPEGKPVYIDHGYSMPGQSLDNGGIAEFRCYVASNLSDGVEFDFDPDWIEAMAIKIQNFVDKDATTLARSYGFDAEEIDALLRRGDSLAERLRGGNFSTLLQKHSMDYGLWGLDDSYIGG